MDAFVPQLTDSVSWLVAWILLKQTEKGEVWPQVPNLSVFRLNPGWDCEQERAGLSLQSDPGRSHGL